jgi:hypothetical protein
MKRQFFGKLLLNSSVLLGVALTSESPVFGQAGAPQSVAQTPNGNEASTAEPKSADATPADATPADKTLPPESSSQTASEKQAPATDIAASGVEIAEISTVPAPYQTDELRVASNASGLDPSSKTAVVLHPLDRAIEIANGSLNKMRTDVRDYSGLFYRRECFSGNKTEPSYMQLKIRCPRPSESKQVPFSIYMKFLKPRQSAGRECIWVDGANESKIVAHEARGLIGMRRFYLEPTGMIAMRESRYPIYDAGIENLILKLIDKAERDRAAGPCVVNIKDNCEVNSRKCTMIEVLHDEQKEPYDFHIARVFIDRETQLPIAYAAYDWPLTPGGKPRLLEEYHYLNLKLNVGLTESDFSADNPSYGFPKR